MLTDKHSLTMKDKAKWLVSCLLAGELALIIMFCGGYVQAGEADFIQSTEYGEINWSTGVITARGSELKIVRRNLRALIDELRVDNEGLADELTSRNSVLDEKLEHLVQQAQQTKEKRTTAERAQMGLQLWFKGPFVEAFLADKQKSNPGTHPARVGPPTRNPPATGPRFFLGPTGLVLDARGLGAKPALFPRILSEDGRLVYDLNSVNRSYTVQQGLVVYMRDVAVAEANKRVANNPRLIRALRIAPDTDTDLIISNRDADRLIRDSKRHDFLKKCRVIIVLD
jgi:hypothetical protein